MVKWWIGKGFCRRAVRNDERGTGFGRILSFLPCKRYLLGKDRVIRPVRVTVGGHRDVPGCRNVYRTDIHELYT